MSFVIAIAFVSFVTKHNYPYHTSANIYPKNENTTNRKLLYSPSSSDSDNIVILLIHARRSWPKPNCKDLRS